jgi:hypothetical protein
MARVGISSVVSENDNYMMVKQTHAYNRSFISLRLGQPISLEMHVILELRGNFTERQLIVLHLHGAVPCALA